MPHKKLRAKEFCVSQTSGDIYGLSFAMVTSLFFAETSLYSFDSNNTFSLLLQEYTYDYARDREHLVRFHKEAEARKFNLAKYNGIKESMAKLQSEMTFLKSAQLRLPSRTDVAEQSN